MITASTIASAAFWGAVLATLTIVGIAWPVRYPGRHRAED